MMLVAACPPREEAWVAPGATTSNLEFVVGETHHEEMALRIRYVSVTSCTAHASTNRFETFWKITAVNDSARLSRIRYGEIPGGYEEEVPPSSLVPACYLVWAGSRAKFIVREDGTVNEVAH